MLEKLYLHFLILCGILCQGIIAPLPDKDTRESSNFLIRKRRVITHIPDEQVPTPIQQANYMVNIKQNRRAHCAGVILSHYTVLTIAPCVLLPVTNYTVFAGVVYENRGSVHTVIGKDEYYGNPPHERYEGIALLTVDPPFRYTTKIGHIHFYEGHLATGTLVTVRGWGCSYPRQPLQTHLQRALRSIVLPIISHEQCQNAYREYFTVTEKHICTYDVHRYCARTDGGAPLLVNNQLAGIHVHKGEHADTNPDVFINLQREDYRAWIRETAILM